MPSPWICQSCRARLWQRRCLLKYPRPTSKRPFACTTRLSNRRSPAKPAFYAPDSSSLDEFYNGDIFESYRRSGRASGRYSRYSNPRPSTELEEREINTKRTTPGSQSVGPTKSSSDGALGPVSETVQRHQPRQEEGQSLRYFTKSVKLKSELENQERGSRVKSDKPGHPGHPAARHLEMTIEGRPILERWKHFETVYHSPTVQAIQSPSFKDMDIISKGLFIKLMWEVLDAWLNDPAGSSLPEPVDLVKKMVDLKFADSFIWSPVLHRMSLKLVEASATDNPKSSAQLLQLARMWREFLARHKPDSDIENTDKDDSNSWEFLPPLVTHQGQRRLSMRLQLYFPLIRLRALAQLGSATILTFCLLIHERGEFRLTEKEIEGCWPLVTFIAGISSTASVENDMGYLHKSLESLDLSNEVFTKWQSMAGSVRAEAAIINNESDPMNSPNASRSHLSQLSLSERITLNENALLKSTARAVESQNLSLVRHKWETTQSLFDGVMGKTEAPIPERVYNFFLTSFMELQDPDSMTEVWNSMMRRGVQPSDFTWTAVLSGCYHLRDPVALEAFWQRMIAHGHEPTSHNWKAYIFGLISMGQQAQGLQHLDEMGRRYRASLDRLAKWKNENGKNPKFNLPQPNITAAPEGEIVNAAIKAISRKSNPDWNTIDRLRKWAASFNIEPDIYTYNPLIRLAFRRGDQTKAFQLLDEMGKKGIEADASTYTTIINNMFRLSLISGEENQDGMEKRVQYILKDLKQRNFLNKYVFTALIDGLVRQGSMDAVHIVYNAILDFDQSIPGPVLTILARYYFNQDPPDITSVNKLWTRAMGSRAVADVFFFDRMVEGYARAGEIGKMNEVLLKMSRESKRPSWPALYEVVQCLSRAGDYNTIRQVVSDVKEGGGELVFQPRGGHGAHKSEADFWAFIEDLSRGQGIQGKFADPQSEYDPRTTFMKSWNPSSRLGIARNLAEELKGSGSVE